MTNKILLAEDRTWNVSAGLGLPGLLLQSPQHSSWWANHAENCGELCSVLQKFIAFGLFSFIFLFKCCVTLVNFCKSFLLLLKYPRFFLCRSQSVNPWH